jgi:Putative zinc finger in N-recognin (UBR box)
LRLSPRPFDADRPRIPLTRAVEDLDTLQKNPLELKLESSTICKLTSLVTNEIHHTAQDALDRLSILGSAIPRRVCQFPFKRNDIVWVCRTCQADETCVLCHICYKQSNHDGHDVAFYHAQAGGCDCGDPDAWDPKGFCPHHGGGKRGDANLPDEKVKDLVQTMAAWIVKKICGQTKLQHLRTQLKEEPDQVSVDDVDAVGSLTSSAVVAPAAPVVPHEMRFNSQAVSTSKSRGDMSLRTRTKKAMWKF